MTKQELIEYGLTIPGAAADAPFDDESVVLRCRANRKWFALLLQVQGECCVNLKCDPMRADFYRRLYRDVTPGWHMNKTHWNTVRLGGDVPDEELQNMLLHSYDLVRPRGTKRAAPDR